MDTIPRPLLDRMDDIRLAGYLPDEKLEIATKHLWPRLLKRNNVKKSAVSLSSSAIKLLIEGYAREAGVRNLEKLLAKILRKSVVKLLSGDKKVTINNQTLTDFVGPPIFRKERQLKGCLLYTSPSPRDQRGSRMPSSA